ncbi:MAG: aminopeptidase P N-terminal domain-containing protein [Clostridiaceae bacterium]|nr:aminopeptidase P N-terminal domain-containing protein [Clostridiaceae bacterium]
MPDLDDHSRLPAAFFADTRRQLLRSLEGQPSLVLLAAGRPPHRTADEDYPFLANRNFYYLCGIEQADTLLILYQNNGIRREILFIPPKDPHYERWHGRMIGFQEAAALSGLEEIQYITSFEGVLSDLLAASGVRLYLDFSADNSQMADLRSWLTEKWPLCQPTDAAPLLIRQRMIKSADEIKQMSLAIDLTGKGIAAMARRLQPNIMEYQLWAEFNRTLADEGCLTPAFSTIVAAGANIFCLHYMLPTAQIRDGDLVQVDVGAVAGGLCADISRVYPANGHFTADQLVIYNLVRRCQETAFAAIRPGVTLASINEQCRAVTREGLMSAGIMKENETAADYFWHNVSHHLGFDVHDPAERETLLKPGMVLTVEPGIYVPNLGVGLRLEDDVLVTESGCVNLSAAIPRESWEIEALMATGK